MTLRQRLAVRGHNKQRRAHARRTGAYLYFQLRIESTNEPPYGRGARKLHRGIFAVHKEPLAANNNRIHSTNTHTPFVGYRAAADILEPRAKIFAEPAVMAAQRIPRGHD